VVEVDKKQKLLLEKHKDIARIDQDSKRTHGWYVRVRFLGKTHSKFFSDRKCGGRYSSLLSAISWRDQTEKKLGKVRTNKHMVTVSNSGTGVVGVRHNEKLPRANRVKRLSLSESMEKKRPLIALVQYAKKEKATGSDKTHHIFHQQSNV
jgi:hypothetical protein